MADSVPQQAHHIIPKM